MEQEAAETGQKKKMYTFFFKLAIQPKKQIHQRNLFVVFSSLRNRFGVSQVEKTQNHFNVSAQKDKNTTRPLAERALSPRCPYTTSLLALISSGYFS